MISPLTEKLIKQLSKENLSLEDKTALVTALLYKVGAFPLSNMIVYTPNGIRIDGKDLDTEQYLNFKEASIALRDNFARRVINEQLKYKATEIGIHKSITLDELYFSKAIIWVINEENKLLERLSTE